MLARLYCGVQPTAPLGGPASVLNSVAMQKAIACMAGDAPNCLGRADHMVSFVAAAMVLKL
jgi:hypothetical protein